MTAPRILDAEGRFQRRQLAELLREARWAIEAAEAGDVEMVFTAHRALSRAVVVILRPARSA